MLRGWDVPLHRAPTIKVGDDSFIGNFAKASRTDYCPIVFGLENNQDIHLIFESLFTRFELRALSWKICRHANQRRFLGGLVRPALPGYNDRQFTPVGALNAGIQI